MRFDWLGRSAAVAMIAALPLASLNAETLQEALADAYNNNPDITSQRAAVQALDANVLIQQSFGRPGLDATASYNQVFDDIGGFDTRGKALTGTVGVTVPLYLGGRVRNSVRAADQRVLAARETLRAVENTVLSGVVTAYLDTQRDATVVDLNRNQVKVLREQLRASRDRFEVGDLTRTDVAQSEARLALADSNLRLSEAQLVASQENYRRVVGHGPGVLAPPPPLPALPGTADQAVDLAVADNPTLSAARLAERAAAYDVSVVRANRLPSIGASGGLRYQDTFANSGGGFVIGPGGVPVPTTGGSTSVDRSHNVGVSATIPLYQGGLVSGQVRQAQARRSQAMEQIAVSERNTVAQARNAFEGVVSSNAVIQSANVAVNANALALEGTRQENLVGSRNILDVLNAEQELLNARVTLVRAQRDAYVAGFTLLSAIGRADSDSLNLAVQRYDPTVNYKDTKGTWSDWDDGPTPRPIAQPTAPTAKMAPGVAPAVPAASTTTPVTTTTTTVTTTKK